MGILKNKVVYKVYYDKYNLKNNTAIGSSTMLVITDTVDNAMDAVIQYWGKSLYKIVITSVNTDKILVYKEDDKNLYEQLKQIRDSNNIEDKETTDILDKLLKKVDLAEK